MFKVGQKVVCIDDAFTDKYVRNGVLLPEMHKDYTIRGFNRNGAMWLVEIKNFDYPFSTGGTGEPAFKTFRFRPLDEIFAEETLARIAKEVEQEQLIAAL